MGIYIKSENEILRIKEAGRIVAMTLRYIEDFLKPEVSLLELETICDEFIRKHNGVSAFKGYRGFPSAVCISLNEEVVHGIPDDRKLKIGDLVQIDVGVFKNGCYADGAKTFYIGNNIDPKIKKLLTITEEALYLGIKAAKIGNRIGDISSAIQKHVEKHGFSVVRELGGHGVGLFLHEEPIVPNFGKPKEGLDLQKGMTLAIEPMVNMGKPDVVTAKNNWTVITKDRLPSAHFEHTIAITETGAEILTKE
ncbi:MAG: type I methionyl aminopeptidase [candidate division WOR-3 bacterium]|nr:type I methionyl aminopeptidase [candidate division WOR-3 bacterium]